MTVLIEDEKIEIFTGAKVRDVLLKYSKDAYKSTLAEELIVVDKDECEVGLDGAVSEGQKLFIRKNS